VRWLDLPCRNQGPRPDQHPERQAQKARRRRLVRPDQWIAVSAAREREWHYVLLGEQVFYDWRDKGASIRDMLEYAKLRPIDERVQAQFSF
jgi:hypothetical protein